MRCPYCRHHDSRVVDSREVGAGDAIRRRRSCPRCERRFTTVEETSLVVVKRSGATEPFSRDKVIDGVRKALGGRAVAEDALALLAQRVEDSLRGAGAGHVPAHQVGLAILVPLRDLDEVAYLRFASVYRGFSSLDDFAAEIEVLRATRPTATMDVDATVDATVGVTGDLEHPGATPRLTHSSRSGRRGSLTTR